MKGEFKNKQVLQVHMPLPACFFPFLSFHCPSAPVSGTHQAVHFALSVPFFPPCVLCIFSSPSAAACHGSFVLRTDFMALLKGTQATLSSVCSSLSLPGNQGQAHLGDGMGAIPDHHNKASIIIKPIKVNVLASQRIESSVYTIL